MSHGQHGQRWKFTSFSIQKVARPSGTTLQLAVNSRKFCAIRTADNTDGKSRKSIVSEKSPSFRPAHHWWTRDTDSNDRPCKDAGTEMR